MESRTKDIWENRYIKNETSGLGSYNELAKFKSDIINKFIVEYNILSIIDFGCGDGNQINTININKYIGLDISDFIITKIKKKYINDTTKTFYNYQEFEIIRPMCDISLSLDVIYHLVDINIYNKYLYDLVNSASKYIIIYSTNFKDINIQNQFTSHMYHRKFTDDIQRLYPQCKFIKKIPQIYPNNSSADFYIFKII